jgi:hypothetical protein
LHVSSSGSLILPSSKFDPIFRTFRVIKFRPPKLIQQSEHQQQTARENTSEPEKCVTCDVLYDPSPEPIRADVIFIHGLHGSLEKTWKQGLWDVTKVRTVPVRQRDSEPAPPDHDAWSSRSVEGTERDRDLVGDGVRRP